MVEEPRRSAAAAAGGVLEEDSSRGAAYRVTDVRTLGSGAKSGNRRMAKLEPSSGKHLLHKIQ